MTRICEKEGQTKAVDNRDDLEFNWDLGIGRADQDMVGTNVRAEHWVRVLQPRQI